MVAYENFECKSVSPNIWHVKHSNDLNRLGKDLKVLIPLYFSDFGLYSVFLLTWPACMQIYWNKRKRLHEKRIELPEDWFGTPTLLPFHCFGTPIWPS